MVSDLMDARGEMTHASGKFEILNEESYNANVSYSLHEANGIIGIPAMKEVFLMCAKYVVVGTRTDCKEAVHLNEGIPTKELLAD